ncbi:hypothetical protein SAMN05660909_02535 [Chitinophaga terrae (ex Kim and Jung 2007)]|uniref:Uncharacterized protein n=2 Tax=Chitinophaga terrae (ex Kim and Jung 2007) TaxID=408074 RepID=A0A1H4CBX2_9BACT|nr:hypothetical protein [Chitinophaga terrae (ex Kim and Jung 2007)]SEA57887.1 hypothetical protein SAMN05660909_02535 [Chitinophaga terrae (ex Kim and Jung 2007)]
MRNLFLVTVGLLTISFSLSAQMKPEQKEWIRMGNIVGRERKFLQQEACKDCSYILNAKIFLNKQYQADSILLSYSAPASLSGLPAKLIAANINWKLLMSKNKEKRILILPIWYLCERSGGSVLFPSVLDFERGMYQFSDGKELVYDESKYYIFPQLSIFTTAARTEERMLLDSTDLRLRKK